VHREIKCRVIAGQLRNGVNVYHRWRPTDIAHNICPNILGQAIAEVGPFLSDESFRTHTTVFQQPVGVKTITCINPNDRLKWFRRPGHGDKLFVFVIGRKAETTTSVTVEIRRQQNGTYTLVRAYLGEALKLTKGQRFPQCFAYTAEEPRIGKGRRPGVRDKFRRRR